MIFLFTALAPAEVYGGDAAPAKNAAEQNEEQAVENGLLPGAVSIFPGIIIHGAGHYAGGDTETAKDLLLTEGIGLLALIGAGYAVADTGASRKIIIPAMPLITGGAGLFLVSWFSDVYGSFFGPRLAGRQVLKQYLEINGGLTYIYDPQFKYRNFATASVHFKYEKWLISPEAWIALDDDNRRYVVDASYQLIGDSGSFFRNAGEYLDLRFTNRYGYHKFGTEQFLKRWIDFSLTGRLDLGGIWKSLNGSFTQFEAGYNAEWVTFTFDDNIPAEYTDQYLFLSGFGVYLGSPEKPIGEIMIYYNHRRDDFTGGLSMGFTGYAGIEASFHILSRLKVSLDIRYGSALITGMQLSYTI